MDEVESLRHIATNLQRLAARLAETNAQFTFDETPLVRVDGPHGLLRCPTCNGEADYLHHGEVRVYNRDDGEDHPTWLTLVAGKRLERSPSDGNPSSRRNAVTIAFEGECGHAATLTIVQHKGQTFLTWEDVGLVPEAVDE